MKLTTAREGWQDIRFDRVERRPGRPRDGGYLVWHFTAADGRAVRVFSPSWFDPGTKARAILEAAAGHALGPDADTDDFIGARLRGYLAPSAARSRYDLNAVAALDGSMESVIRRVATDDDPIGTRMEGK